MPTVLESAKEAGYTALGLNVLFLDELAERGAEARKQFEERTAPAREQFESQLDIAREHGRKAQADMKAAMPFDIDAVTDAVQERVQPVAKRGFDLAEPAWKRFAEIAPDPVASMVTDGVSRMRDMIIVEEPVAEAPKKAAKKGTAKKTTAKKSSTKTATAKKSSTKK